MLVHLHTVGELCGGVEDGVEAVLRESGLNKAGVAEIALDAGEGGVRVLVGLEVDVDDGVAFAEESTFEYTAKKTGGAGHQIMSHITSIIRNVTDCSLKGVWWPQMVKTMRQRKMVHE